MVMEALQPRQKQEWKTAVDDHWIRTGCHSLWDAVFVAFREYRDAGPEVQKEMIRKKTKTDNALLEEWLRSFYQQYEEMYEERPPALRAFFKLLPLKLFSLEMMPYLENYIKNDQDLTLEQLQEEVVDKCILLADYRQKKKNLDFMVHPMVRDSLTGMLFKDLVPALSYDRIMEGMSNLQHQLIILSPEEEVLFDSKTWGEGMTGGDYQDVILVLAHPDNTYDSIGRLSYTKDGHQKISRLFHYDDDIVEALRKQ